MRRSVTRVDPEGPHARGGGTVAVPHPGRRRQEIVQGAQFLARAAGERPIRAVVRDADGVRPARERPRLDDDGRGVGRPRPVVVGRERDEERHERRVVREEDRQARAVESCAQRGDERAGDGAGIARRELEGLAALHRRDKRVDVVGRRRGGPPRARGRRDAVHQVSAGHAVVQPKVHGSADRRRQFCSERAEVARVARHERRGGEGRAFEGGQRRALVAVRVDPVRRESGRVEVTRVGRRRERVGERLGGPARPRQVRRPQCYMIGRELTNGPRRPVGLAQRAAERAMLREAFSQELAGPALVLHAAAEPVRASARDALDGLAGTGPRRAGGGGQPAAAVGDGRAGAVARDDLDTSQAGVCLRRAAARLRPSSAAAVRRCCLHWPVLLSAGL